ncbi:unnamed protein product [Ostreobium quekettii]|uniref:Ig-like domain-containing protein n=1 Tax=Ostreobium quekettii TaxID=121088 RepID=A0A8S1J9F8_9CHLO|nr:unnamed protein product [Ostreobium quekettii]
MVKGHNVPIESPQPYALVVHGKFTGILQSPNNPAVETDVTGGACVIVVAIITEGPQGPTADSTTRFEFSTESGSPALNGFECQLIQPGNLARIDALHDWEPCTSGRTYTDLPDMPYKFSVRPAGEDIVATRDFVVDTTPPITQILGDPVGSQPSQESVAFVFFTRDATAVQFSCRLNVDGPGQHTLWRQDGGDVILGEWVPCISPQRYNGLSFGQWSFEVMGTDEVGNVEATPVSQSWGISFNEGQLYTRTISGPPTIVPFGTVEFKLLALEGRGTSEPVVLLDTALECSLVRADDRSPDWATCSPVQTYDALEDGSFLFEARTVDASGHSRESITQVVFDVDSTSPTVTIERRPERYHGASTVSFFFDADEEVKGFNCSLAAVAENPRFEVCGGPDRGSAEYDIEDGEYAFVVEATDLVGNKGLSDRAEFMVDTAAPVVAIDYKNSTSSSNVSFSFEVSDKGSGVLPANVSCLLRNSGGQVDSEWLQNCTSPATYTLAEGKYVFNVRAVDRARLQNELKDYVVTVDQTPPVSSISKGPPEGQILPARVSFTFTAEDQPAEIASQVASSECHLSFVQPLAPELDKEDGGDDNGLNVGGNENNKLMSTSQPAAIKDGDVSISILDGPTFTLGAWVDCGSPVTFQLMPSGQYEFRTRATDHAGNRGNATEAYLFEVDATLPIPGEGGDSSSSTPTWMWIVIIVSVAGALLMVLIAVGRCRRKARRAQQQRPGYQYYANGSSPGGAYSVPNGAISAAMAASVQQQSIEEQNRVREERRLAAALAASKEEYNLQQALKQSLQEQQAPSPLPAAVAGRDDDLQRAIALSLADSASAPPQPWP